MPKSNTVSKYPSNTHRDHPHTNEDIDADIAGGKADAMQDDLTFADIADAILLDASETRQLGSLWAARPYLDALQQIHSADPEATIPGFPLEDAHHITLYLLGNLRTYKGEGARANKTALKKMAGIK